jgi:hypothetical protein
VNESGLDESGIDMGGLYKEFITERDFFINNLMVRIRFIIVTMRWTGLAPSLHSLFQVALHLPS